MTTTLTLPVEAAHLEGKSRAELLEYCKQAGLKATAWKRDRMHAVLTGVVDKTETTPVTAVIAEQLERRETGDLAKRALELRLKRTGRCLSTVCDALCESYLAGVKDAFGWQLCECGHTQWAHADEEAEAKA